MNGRASAMYSRYLPVYLVLVLAPVAHAFLFQQHLALQLGPFAGRPRVSLYRCSSARPGLRVSATASADAVLELIRDTDIGANSTALPPEKRKVLYENLDALELQARQTAEGDPLGPGGAAIGMWTVDFVGETDATNEVRQKKSSPAGGYWRGGICKEHRAQTV